MPSCFGQDKKKEVKELPRVSKVSYVMLVLWELMLVISMFLCCLKIHDFMSTCFGQDKKNEDKELLKVSMIEYEFMSPCYLICILMPSCYDSYDMLLCYVHFMPSCMIPMICYMHFMPSCYDFYDMLYVTCTLCHHDMIPMICYMLWALIAIMLCLCKAYVWGKA